MAPHIDRLDAPLRLTWNPGVPDQLEPGGYERIAAEIIDAAPFFLLVDICRQNFRQLESVLMRLMECSIQVSVRVPAEDDLFIWMHGLPLNGERLVSLDHRVSPVEELHRLLGKNLDAATTTGVSLVPADHLLPQIPALIDLADTFGMSKISLPNLPLDDTSVAGFSAPLSPGAILDLEQSLRASGWKRRGETLLAVHDLFLWRVFRTYGAGEHTEYGGCQAANALAHITSQGELFPCSTWPHPLGSLHQESFFDLWDGPEREQILNIIERSPGGCSGCTDLCSCKGGCRGLSWFVNRHHDAIDPHCTIKKSGNK